MALPTFYFSNLKIGDDEICLDDNELLHARQARRLKVGSRVLILNGCGLIADGRVALLDRREFRVTIEKTTMAVMPESQLNLAVAAPKGDRQRFMVDSLTQLGVNSIQTIEFERSVNSNTAKLMTKWPRYAIEAIKQSQNPWLPEVLEPNSLTAWLDALVRESYDLVLVADGSGESLARLINGSTQRISCLAVIGPEGGLTPQELELLKSYGFSPWSLGSNILRIETAAISCAAQWLGASA